MIILLFVYTCVVMDVVSTRMIQTPMIITRGGDTVVILTVHAGAGMRLIIIQLHVLRLLL